MHGCIAGVRMKRCRQHTSLSHQGQAGPRSRKHLDAGPNAFNNRAIKTISIGWDFSLSEQRNIAGQLPPIRITQHGRIQ